MIKKIKNAPLWLQVLLILLIGVIASIIVLLCINLPKLGGSDEKLNDEEYTVTFAYQDGTVIDTKKVKEGFGVFPPSFETDCVFRGWSSAVNHITSNIEVHPLLYTIVEENLFYFDSVYVKEGGKFTLELYVAGNVNFNDCELELEYDAEVMDFIASETSENCSVRKLEEGKLSFTVTSNSTIAEKTKLADLTFLAKEKDVYSSQVTLASKGATVKTNGKDLPVDSATINNQIYYLQEVEQ